jgi:hypothetical protein
MSAMILMNDFFMMTHYFLEKGIRKDQQGKANNAYKTGDEEDDDDDEILLSNISTNDLIAAVERLTTDPSMQILASRDETIKNLSWIRGLFNDRRFQKSFEFAQKVRCNFFLSYLIRNLTPLPPPLAVSIFARSICQVSL